MRRYIDGFKKYDNLLFELVKKGIKLKYRRSYLGVIWTLLEPLLTMMVLTVVFSSLLPNNDPTFPVYILTGRLIYSFFSQATKSSMRSIRANSAMIKKVYVPKYLYPLSCVLFNFVIFAISLIVLVGVCLFFGVYPTLYWLEALISLILLLLLSLGSGLILSTLSVFFRDLEYLWDVLLMIIMYTCAIFYKVEKIMQSGNGWIFKINPLYAIIRCFRNSIYGYPLELKWLALAGVSSVASVVVGVLVFYKNQDKFLLHV